MRLVLWANGNRGVRCLEQLVRDGSPPSLVVVHTGSKPSWYASVAQAAARLDIPTIAPADPNGKETVERLRRETPELFVLAGFGPILRRPVLDIPKRLTINLHGGRLPEYRGSSPMNWALIYGEDSFTLSIIRVDEGVDTGDVLLERSFPISQDDTIVDLHRTANEAFPEMLSEVIGRIVEDKLEPRQQDPARARYFPLRFPDDGLVLWDLYSAEQIHNRIRALRPPYPGAFTFYRRRRVQLISSKRRALDYMGEPGRIYRKTPDGLLVCAKNKCLWITEAVFTDDETPLAQTVNRYDKLATVQEAAARFHEERTLIC